MRELYCNFLSTFVVCIEHGAMLTVHQGQASGRGHKRALGRGGGLGSTVMSEVRWEPEQGGPEQQESLPPGPGAHP